MTTVPCLRCGQSYEKADRGRGSAFCKPCRKINNRIVTRHRMRAAREIVRDMRNDPDPWLESHGRMVDDRDTLIRDLLRRGEDLNDIVDHFDKFVPDRNPESWLSPRGSDDGITVENGTETFGRVYGDKGLVLQACKVGEGFDVPTIADQFWRDNPHVFWRLRNEAIAELLDEPERLIYANGEAA